MKKERTNIEWQHIGYNITASTANPCQCCGRHVWTMHDYAIHTDCIRRHWANHRHGENASRCREFKYADKVS
jgi:hypothetical protein